MNGMPILARSVAGAAAFVLLVAATSTGCQTPKVAAGAYRDSDVHYTLAEPGAGWSRVNIGDANGAWFNEELSSALLVNSHCQGVKDAPLEALARELTIGMTEREELKARKFTLSRREAFETELTAKLDGVPRHLVVLVLKKDGCVYDVVLDANPDNVERARPAYEAMRDSLDVQARPGS